MEFINNIRVLANESAWHIWKRKIQDLLNYHDFIDGKFVAPDRIKETASEQQDKFMIVINHYRKANSFSRSMLLSVVMKVV